MYLEVSRLGISDLSKIAIWGNGVAASANDITVIVLYSGVDGFVIVSPGTLGSAVMSTTE